MILAPLFPWPRSYASGTRQLAWTVALVTHGRVRLLGWLDKASGFLGAAGPTARATGHDAERG